MGQQKKPEKVPKRLWMANEILIKASIGEIEIKGKENIASLPPDAKIVIMTTHLTDVDMPIAIHAVAKDLDVAVMNMSTHHRPGGPQGEFSTYVGVVAAGKKNFIPIDTHQNKLGKKSAKGFNPENFTPAAKALGAGKAVMVAAHNPSSEPQQNLEGIRGGYGGVYLAEMTNAFILPVTVVLDKAAGMEEDKLKTIKEKPNASVVIGKPFQLQKIPGIERFSELTEKIKSGEKLDVKEREELIQLKAGLREQSAIVMQKMSGQLILKS
jgi:hypothetical protein